MACEGKCLGDTSCLFLSKMFHFHCLICCFLLALYKPACGWARDNDSEITCSQGLSECKVSAEMPIGILESDSADVQILTVKVELCCNDILPCTLCLLIDAELIIHEVEDMDKRLNLAVGTKEDATAAFVTLCYKTPQTFPACKRVDFTVNPKEFKQKVAKVSLVITNPAGVSFDSIVIVYVCPSKGKVQQLIKEVMAPSLDEVCSKKLPKPINECYVPTVDTVINIEMNQVELQSAERSKVCVQYEEDGRCQSWESETIPLHSVTPCLCLQVWDDDKQIRSQSCPFKNAGFLQKNIWQNLTVSVGHGQMNDNGQMLLWNLSAPCRLEGEVWPCQQTWNHNCIEIEGFRQKLENRTWEQESHLRWVKMGVFEDIDLQLSPCVMLNLRTGDRHVGPICCHYSTKWHWTLLIGVVLLVIALTALMHCLLRGFVKKWTLSLTFQGECAAKSVQKGHVVLLSPPDSCEGVSEVCSLGCLLRSQGFSVSVDQWCRMEQCNLGPLPWLHSQLLHVKNLGGRAVLILTRRAMGLVHEWSRQHWENLQAERLDRSMPQSPYSDVFVASLHLILRDKQQGRTGERFLLVTFDHDIVQPPCSLPELFQGLHLFQLPSQMNTLLCELAGGTGKGKGGQRTKAGWKWGILDGWKLKTKEATRSQRKTLVQCKYSGI
ncbi:uncharacterized protein il17rc isoform X1 [Corythoichthys intestinalis]|uniref:uncharacterized protein il17rc isoform X1 n=1 Tax=Corythoichthys intestinalis TaxID=161448 RepID=UPI0025A63BBD|nr:uncharacterized protein il17rc isoform X1 [Corythoichthys intestinalis]